MSSDKQGPPSFSVLLAEYEGELYETLQQIQSLPSNTILDEGIEQRIHDVTITIKLLRLLVNEKWELQGDKTDNYSYIRKNGEKLIVTSDMLRRNLVADILHLAQIVTPRRYFTKPSDCFEICLPIDINIYVKAKHSKLPQPTTKLTKVALADGNTAWLTEQTLKAVQEVIANK